MSANYYEIVEIRDGVPRAAVSVLFERRIDAVICARKLRRDGRKVKVRAVRYNKYTRR